mgnify:CR=1 FL=1
MIFLKKKQRHSLQRKSIRGISVLLITIKKTFGLRWLFLHMNIHPNAYYNYLKKTRTNYHRQKKAILNTIRDIYHECNGKK